MKHLYIIFALVSIQAFAEPATDEQWKEFMRSSVEADEAWYQANKPANIMINDEDSGSSSVKMDYFYGVELDYQPVSSQIEPDYSHW